jgi:hypothetical protein
MLSSQVCEIAATCVQKALTCTLCSRLIFELCRTLCTHDKLACIGNVYTDEMRRCSDGELTPRYIALNLLLCCICCGEQVVGAAAAALNSAAAVIGVHHHHHSTTATAVTATVDAVTANNHSSNSGAAAATAVSPGGLSKGAHQQATEGGGEQGGTPWTQVRTSILSVLHSIFQFCECSSSAQLL